MTTSASIIDQGFPNEEDAPSSVVKIVKELHAEFNELAKSERIGSEQHIARFRDILT